MKKLVKRLLCFHSYKTLYNIHGGLTNGFRGHRRVDECIKCGKQRYGNTLNKKCNSLH